MHILCAWEFGSGLGHVRQFIPLVDRLLARGHRLTLVVQQPAQTAEVLRAECRAQGSLNILQAPIWSAEPTYNPQALQDTWSNPFHAYGYHRPEKLALITDIWGRILAETKPDLLVTEAAPTARLAAPPGLPVLALGTGFTMPPEGRLLPPLRPWVSADSIGPRARAEEAELLCTVNSVRALRGGPPVDFFADLMNGHTNFLCTLDLLDPYAAYRTDRAYFRSLAAPMIAERQPIAARQDAPIFVYLHHDNPQLGNVLAALGKLGVAAEAYIMNGQALTLTPPSNVTLHTKPADFGAILGRYRLLIHHGGLATSYTALEAGIPQLFLPRQLEQTITAQILIRHAGGVGQSAHNPDMTAETLAGFIETQVTPTHWPVIEAAATRFAFRPLAQTLSMIVDSIEELRRCF